MPLVVLSDVACDHPKLLKAGPNAGWLWLRALCWCRRYPSTRGRIPKAELVQIAAGIWSGNRLTILANALVRGGLWHEETNCYRIHDYDQFDLTVQLAASNASSSQPSKRPGRPSNSPSKSASNMDDGKLDATTPLFSSELQEGGTSAEKKGGGVREEEDQDAADAARAREGGHGRQPVLVLDGTVDGAAPMPIGRRSLRVQMAHAWDGIGGVAVSGQNRSRITRCEPLLLRIAAEQGREPIEVFKGAVARFKSDAGTIKKRLGLAVLCSQLEQWCAPDPKPERTAGEIRAEQSAEHLKLMEREVAESEQKRMSADEMRAATAALRKAAFT